jgi:hypothetical protein
VNPQLCFEDSTDKNLESLVQSSRIFEQLKFSNESDYLSDLDKFEMIEKYIRSTGNYLKSLVIRERTVDQEVAVKLLDLQPNLESLDIFTVISGESITTKISTKIERLEMISCVGFEKLLESLEKCAIKEMTLHTLSLEESAAFQKLLKSQEKNLKKLTIRFNCGFLVDLKDLRLEYLDYDVRENVSTEFLNQQVDLKTLKLLLSNSLTLSVGFELKLWSAWLSDLTEILTQ